MEEPKNKYILLNNRVGNTVERDFLVLGPTPSQVLRGELLEAIPESEQPTDLNRIALVGIERKSLRLECRTEDLTRLSDEDANLLLAISSIESRFQTFIDRKRLDFGRRLSPLNQVFVSVKGYTKAGVVRYKGELPAYSGTMFGVELINPGQGNTDGTFRNKQYFTCAPDSGVFVGLDKLTPREDPDSKSPPKSPRRDDNAQVNFKSRLKDTVLLPFFKGKYKQKLPQERFNQVLEIDQRVVAFIEDHPVRGTVRYIGQERDSSGNVRTIVGLEMDERVGVGTGKRNGRQLFVCKRDYAGFVAMETIIPEEDFDEIPKENKREKTLEQQDAIQEQIRKNESLAKSMSDDYRPSVHREKDPKENLETQLREMEQQLANVQQQLREKELQEANLSEQLREKNQQVTRMQNQLREKDRELENSERVSREKEQRLTNFQRQLREKELQLREQDQQEENFRGQLSEIQQQLREKDELEENLQRRLREMGQQLTNLQGQFGDKENETANLQQQVAILDGQLRMKDRQVNELEITLSTAQQTLSEHQRQQSPDWVISRDQIQLTDKLLGKGGWGSVVEGKYCGCAVAVKQIHELILSPHNQSLFEREMDIASRCRHPCLLQFIGATNDEGSPLFVTELMESSLRGLLEQRSLSVTEVSIISLDVARALNYLHQKKPSPIIHRDISSANVLLWRQGDQWRGKVSDYGTANFMQHTMTAAPGAMIYIAPEALTSKQTVKVDVYSFGVLLCEMCIRELPDPARRDQQIAMVTNHVLRALIRECLKSEPEPRPNMEEIIEELEKAV